MADQQAAARNGAYIVLTADGGYDDASATALDLLGVTLDELRALPPGSLSTTSDADRLALRSEWERSKAREAVGETTITRPDGQKLRVRFALTALPDGRYRAVFDVVDRPAERPLRLYTVGDVLTAWRAADRRLRTLRTGSSEWRAVHAEIEELRRSYQELFEAQLGTQGDNRGP